MLFVAENSKGAVNVPLLSIITVCLNDVVRLKKTIDSLSAFYGDERFEHLVIDGDSVDETDVLVEPFLKETNFKYRVVSDSGIYDAMNLGVLYCRSPLLLFLNCGDAIIAEPDDLFDVLEALVNKNDVVHDITCFSVLQVANGKEVVRALKPQALPRHKMPTSHQGMIISKQFMMRNQYEADYKIAGDYDLYLRADNVEILGEGLCKPLVAVEAEGYASRHSLRAYYEYLLVANRRLRGKTKVIALLRIGIRALFVVSLKAVIPPRWVSALKGQ